MSAIGKVVVAGAVAICSGCLSSSGPDCIDETRALSVAARLSAGGTQALPSDTGRAHLSLSEARNHRSKSTTYQNVTWFVGSGLVRSRVTSVHVHEAATDRVLFDVPIDTMFGPPYVITQVLQAQPYSGALGWNDFYLQLGSGGAYIDVHTLDRPSGHLRGDLLPEYPNWEKFVHSYCS